MAVFGTDLPEIFLDYQKEDIKWIPKKRINQNQFLIKFSKTHGTNLNKLDHIFKLQSISILAICQRHLFM